jgi:hypothetical protein
MVRGTQKQAHQGVLGATVVGRAVCHPALGQAQGLRKVHRLVQLGEACVDGQNSVTAAPAYLLGYHNNTTISDKAATAAAAAAADAAPH